MSEPDPLYLRAINKYHNDGLLGLILAATKKFTSDFRATLIDRLCMTRDQMTSTASTIDSLWYYGSKAEFEISPPITSPTPPEFDSYLGSHKVQPQFVCEIQDVKINGEYAICLNNKGRFILEEMGNISTLKSRLIDTYGSMCKILEESASAYRIDASNPDYDAVINLVPRHHGGPDHERQGNYGHWLAEDLPRLRGYHRYQEATGRTPTILIKKDPPSWMVETLRLLGFSSSDWVEWDGDSAVASKLVVPQLNHYHSNGTAFDPQGRKWVSKEMKQRIDMSDTDRFPDRIFTSRQGHGSRKIVNYDEVKEVLEEFDITPIRPEEMPLDDQIRLFDQADIIVGPFGANLTNIIFSENSTVVEIFPNDDIRPVFYITANEQGLDYDYIVAEPRTTINDDNMYVNTSKLRKMLSNIIT